MSSKPFERVPLAHPAVATIAAGVRRAEHLDEHPALMRHPIPARLWHELRADGLLPGDAPTPGDAADAAADARGRP